MTAALWAGLATGVFVWLLVALGGPRRSATALAAARQANELLRSADTDDQREQIARSAAAILLSQFARIGAVLVLAGAIPCGAIYLADLAGLASAQETFEAMTEPVFVLVASIGSIAVWVLLRGLRERQPSTRD